MNKESIRIEDNENELPNQFTKGILKVPIIKIFLSKEGLTPSFDKVKINENIQEMNHHPSDLENQIIDLYEEYTACLKKQYLLFTHPKTYKVLSTLKILDSLNVDTLIKKIEKDALDKAKMNIIPKYPVVFNN